MDRVTQGLGILTLVCILAGAVGYYVKGGPSTAQVQAAQRVQAPSGPAAR